MPILLLAGKNAGSAEHMLSPPMFFELQPLPLKSVSDRILTFYGGAGRYGYFQCSYCYGDVVIPNTGFVEPLRLRCQHLPACIVNPCEATTCGTAGAKAVKILEIADGPLRNGGMQEEIKWM
jgi:hypothetical protein